MLKFIAKWLLLKTVLKRFWPLVLVYAVAKRFLPWEKRRGQASS